MGIRHFLLSGDKSRPLCRAALAGLVTGMVGMAGCATDPGVSGLTEQDAAYDTAVAAPVAPTDPARQAAIADIRAKSAAATAKDDKAFPDVFYSYGPEDASAMTRAERLAVEAELDAVLAAQAQASNPAEAERLKARAAFLKRLAQQHAAQAEADIQAASQAAN